MKNEISNLNKALAVLLYDQYDCPEVDCETDEETFVKYIIYALIEKNEDICPFKNYSCECICKTSTEECTEGLKIDCGRETEGVWKEFIRNDESEVELMPFDYDVMPKRNKIDTEGNPMRECNNCGQRTYMLYEEDENYRVVCENCEETHSFKANSLDRAMEKWRKMQLSADCEYCPLGWEVRGYEGECYDCGCMVDEDINWCKKPYSERLEKSKEFEEM